MNNLFKNIQEYISKKDTEQVAENFMLNLVNSGMSPKQVSDIIVHLNKIALKELEDRKEKTKELLENYEQSVAQLKLQK